MSLSILPWYFRVAKQRLLADKRGAWRMLSTMAALGVLRKVRPVPFFSDTELLVPLDWHWFWQYEHLTEYEPNTLRTFVEAVRQVAAGNAVFLDCGAHIGLVTHYVHHECPHIESGWAFEPNPERFRVLEQNCARLSRPMVALQSALSDFAGRARLTIPEGDDDSAYIVPDPHGSIAVTRVDDLCIAAGLGVVMKIDVEGAELSILRGAENALRAAPYFVVLFEAHSEVQRRTGIDPMECVRLLNNLRPCRWSLSGDLHATLDLARPFFEQVTGHVKRDIIVWSMPR